MEGFENKLKKQPQKDLFIYTELQLAYDFFNKELFNVCLPNCVISLVERTNYNGRFSPNSYINKATGEKTSEIAMNSEFMAVRYINITLSTLVHEIVHFLTYIKGEYGHGSYHNKAFATYMRRIGLEPL